MDHDESRDFTVGHHAPPHLYLRSDTTARSSGNALLPHPQPVPPSLLNDATTPPPLCRATHPSTTSAVTVTGPAHSRGRAWSRDERSADHSRQSFGNHLSSGGRPLGGTNVNALPVEGARWLAKPHLIYAMLGLIKPSPSRYPPGPTRRARLTSAILPCSAGDHRPLRPQTPCRSPHPPVVTDCATTHPTPPATTSAPRRRARRSRHPSPPPPRPSPPPIQGAPAAISPPRRPSTPRIWAKRRG
jgi:hypothetical protein